MHDVVRSEKYIEGCMPWVSNSVPLAGGATSHLPPILSPPSTNPTIVRTNLPRARSLVRTHASTNTSSVRCSTYTCALVVYVPLSTRQKPFCVNNNEMNSATRMYGKPLQPFISAYVTTAQHVIISQYGENT